MEETPPSHLRSSTAGPFVVAHRAGNHTAVSNADRGLPALIEADVRLFRGRLELRHLKTLGSLPLYWDRGRITLSWHPRRLLDDLLAADPQTELVLDLKGGRRRVAELVIEALTPHLGSRAFTVCARAWHLLEPFEPLPVRRIYSIGGRRGLRRFLRRFDGARVDGVAVHERLLDPGVVERLSHVAATVMAWPVNDREHAERLLAIGVDGLISDRSQLVLDAVATHRPGRPSAPVRD